MGSFVKRGKATESAFENSSFVLPRGQKAKKDFFFLYSSEVIVSSCSELSLFTKATGSGRIERCKKNWDLAAVALEGEIWSRCDGSLRFTFLTLVKLKLCWATCVACSFTAVFKNKKNKQKKTIKTGRSSWITGKKRESIRCYIRLAVSRTGSVSFTTFMRQFQRCWCSSSSSSSVVTWPAALLLTVLGAFFWCGFWKKNCDLFH